MWPLERAPFLDEDRKSGMIRAMFSRAIRHSPALVVVAACIAACAKSGNTLGSDPMSTGEGSGSGGGLVAGGSGGGGGGYAVDASLPNGLGSGGGPVFTTPDAMASHDACQELAVNFVPKIPLVFVLADRSGSMFDALKGADGGTTNEWDPLRTAALAVIQSLQSQVAFGFGAYTGNAATKMCPILDTVPVALNNFAPIQALYSSLGQPMFKAETPAQMSLDAVAKTLAQAAASQADGGAGGQPGGQYILFVTDGETDFCDDGNAVCPADAVIAELEKLYTQGITTMVLAISSNASNISVPVLHAFANAGAGIMPLAPPSSAAGAPLSPTDIYNQCNGTLGWKQLATTAALGMNQALGTYTLPDAGVANATLYSPDATNVADLTNKIAAALNTVKSCSFDLQGKIKVDLAQAGSGKVTVDGVALPYDPNNGWTMTTATQLDLTGTACQAWRAKGMKIDFAFPCEIIISVAK